MGLKVSISNADIDKNALDVIKKLKHAGFEAYLVGGCVRDLLLKIKPKDFDVATNAHPHEIKQVFRNCRLIGRRFRLAHVYFGRQIIEVATFRAPHDTSDEGHSHESGLIMRDNVFGTLEEDAWRRDFTINAFYYDPDSNRLVDHVNGIEDLHKHTLRIIGDPEKRYREDPVRMLRAIRFAAKLDFILEEKTRRPITQLGHLLSLVSPARLFEEMIKLFHSGHAVTVFKYLMTFELFEKIFPQTFSYLQKGSKKDIAKRLIELTLKNTDLRIQQGKTVTPAFIFAVFLWYPLIDEVKQERKKGISLSEAIESGGHYLLKQQQGFTAIPKFLSASIREMWSLQYRLERTQGMKAVKLLSHPRFRAAYDLLMLRVEVGEVTKEIGEWWTQFQDLTEEQREQFVHGKGDKKRRPRKNSKRKRLKQHESNE